MFKKKSTTKSQEYAESIVNTVREPLITLDKDLRVVTASRSFYEVFKVTPEETVGQLIYDLGNKQWDIPKLRELLETILPQQATFDDYEVDHEFATIGRRVMLLNARRIPNPPEKLKVILLAIEDITKRKSGEEASLGLAAIVNTSVDGIIGKTLHGVVVSWNKGAEKIYGYTEKEMKGHNISVLAPPGYEKEMHDQFNRIGVGETINNHETKRVRKDGVVIDVSLTLSSIKDRSGKITGVSAVMHDITSEKRTRKMQVVSEYSESIINTVREPLIVLDQYLRVVTVSPSFYEVFKVKPEETVGQLIYDLGNKQWNIPRLRELLETILPQKTAFDNYEVEHDFATIGRRIMLLNARQIERVLGKERIILLAIEDITERRKLEEAHSALAAIVESADDAIKGENLTGTVISWNKGAEHLYGYTAGEIVGKPISLLMPPDLLNEFKEVLLKIVKGETIKHYETQRKRKNGQIVDVSLSISPMKDSSGKIIGASTIARDITERKKIEAGLEKTRKELAVIKKTADEASEFAESIIDTVREPLISLDQDLRVVMASRSFYEVFKVNPKETVGHLIYDLGNKQWNIPKLRELLETILPQKASFNNYEVEHNFATIGRRVMLLNARQIQRVSGKERIILLAIEDITERKEIEAGLEKTRKELVIIKKSADEASEFAESMINTVREPLLSLDQDLRVVTVSRSFYDFFKVKPEETVGQLIYDLGNKQWDIPKLRELLETILPQKATFENYEVEHDFTTIGKRIMLLNARQIKRTSKTNERIILLAIEDITERKEIEAGLEKTRKELVVIKKTADEVSEFAESVINTVREPLLSLDQDLRVVTVSRSFYEFFKVKPEETVGQLIYDLGNKQWNIPKLRELLETILPQKASFENYEVEHNFTTIGRKIMLLNARQIQRGAGKERIILLAIEDITERREIETGLEKAHEELYDLATELKRVARVKSEFLANMSHELRTPLNSINGFSEVLYDETFGTLNEKQKKYVNNVLTSGKHLLLLINQILDMAKVESGKMKLALSILPMKGLLHEIALLVADMVSKNKLQMQLEIAEDLPDIEADELKVKEIIYNLLSNAVKFTPEGGKIGMRARKTGSEIEVVVWDTGVGIADENMGKIFEGFFRVDTPFSRVTEGTGLGLPLSKKLVELHRGKFTVESGGLDKGTSVRFTLPILSKREA